VADAIWEKEYEFDPQSDFPPDGAIAWRGSFQFVFREEGVDFPGWREIGGCGTFAKPFSYQGKILAFEWWSDRGKLEWDQRRRAASVPAGATTDYEVVWKVHVYGAVDPASAVQLAIRELREGVKSGVIAAMPFEVRTLDITGDPIEGQPLTVNGMGETM
jgi:hypothetical protein